MQVLEGAVFLCQLLAREFIFAPVSFPSNEKLECIPIPQNCPVCLQPCMGMRTALGDTIDTLVNCEVLRVPVVRVYIYLCNS